MGNGIEYVGKMAGSLTEVESGLLIGALNRHGYIGMVASVKNLKLVSLSVCRKALLRSILFNLTPEGRKIARLVLSKLQVA